MLRADPRDQLRLPAGQAWWPWIFPPAWRATAAPAAGETVRADLHRDLHRAQGGPGAAAELRRGWARCASPRSAARLHFTSRTIRFSSRWSSRRCSGGLFGPRAPWAHKGDFGHVLVIGGSRGKTGAAAMAGMAALRVGRGAGHGGLGGIRHSGDRLALRRADDRAAARNRDRRSISLRSFDYDLLAKHRRSKDVRGHRARGWARTRRPSHRCGASWRSSRSPW